MFVCLELAATMYAMYRLPKLSNATRASGRDVIPNPSCGPQFITDQLCPPSKLRLTVM
jgi:hypothetical protein